MKFVLTVCQDSETLKIFPDSFKPLFNDPCCVKEK